MLDFAPWDHLLQQYVNGQGRVDYDRWQQESLHPLDQWLTEMRQVEVEALERDSAIACLINLYNALTIRQVLHRYPIDSIRPTFLGIPNWIAFLRFFSRTVYTLDGRSLSLNGIEHDILRSRFQESRIHFALVCASIGCPLLRSGAYKPDQLNEQLDADARRFINNPDKVRYDGERQILYCSKIFKWYEVDFQAVASSIPRYVNRFLGEGSLADDTEIAYLPYSWALNQRTSS